MPIIDFLFPKKCIVCKKQGQYLCENCFSFISFDPKSLCLICNSPSFDGLTHPRCLNRYSIEGCFSAISYNRAAQKLIYSFKYKPFLLDLRHLLGEFFYESIIQNEQFQTEIKKQWILVPIPLFPSKLRKRGYNQSEILSQELAGKFKFEKASYLDRTINTKNQFSLSKDQRKNNIKGSFAFKNIFSENIKNKNIFLVDDIVTTGATLKEAGRILKKAGAKRVIGLTLARD